VIEGAYSEILGNTSIKPFVFLDAGYVENDSLTTATSRPSSNVIASAGIGLDYQFNDSLNSIRMWLGKPIHDDASALDGPTTYVQFQTAW
jgi:hemolysin activation/secretion protein